MEKQEIPNSLGNNEELDKNQLQVNYFAQKYQNQNIQNIQNKQQQISYKKPNERVQTKVK